MKRYKSLVLALLLSFIRAVTMEGDVTCITAVFFLLKKPPAVNNADDLVIKDKSRLEKN